jgi:hypothetical protein
MISVVTRPPLISFAGNPVRYALESDNFTSSSGTNASLTIDFDDIDEFEDHTFALNTPSRSEVFLLKDTDPGNGNTIPTAGLGESGADWIIDIVAALAKNYFLYNNYDITYGATSITLDAKLEGTDFTLRCVNTDVVGIAEGAHTDGADICYRTGFGVLLGLYDGSNNLIGEDFRSVDNFGDAVFDLSDYLVALMEQFTPPAFHITPAVNNSSLHYYGIKQYFIRFCEKYTNTTLALYPDDINYAVRYAVMGGLSREAMAWWNDQDASFWENPVNLMRFLTWCPRAKNTTTTQLERLFFLVCNIDNLDLTPHIEVTFDDNSTSVFTLDAISMEKFCVVELQVGYQDLLLGEIHPEKTVIGWKVWLANESGSVSEAFPFTLDERIREYDRQFIFRNSFGWYDTALMTGKIEQGIEFDRTTGYTILEEQESVYNAPDKAFLNKEQQTYKGSTGWLKKDCLDWFRDMFLSKEIYEVIDGRCYPVIITSKKVVKGKDAEYNLQLDIEYCRSYNDVFYSPVGILNSQSPSPPPSNRNYCDSYSPSYS